MKIQRTPLLYPSPESPEKILDFRVANALTSICQNLPLRVDGDGWDVVRRFQGEDHDVVNASATLE